MTKTKPKTKLLTSLAKLATHKAVSDADYKVLNHDLSPGTYEVSSVIRIVGALKKGEDYEGKIAAKADPWKLLGLALNKLNAVSIDALVRDSLAVGDEEAEAIKAKAQLAIEQIVAITKTTCTGKLSAALVWSEVL